MNNSLTLVRQFHTTFGFKQDIGYLTQQSNFARARYIAEELSELYKALASGDLDAQMDAVADTAYFALGTLAILGEGALMDANDDELEYLFHSDTALPPLLQAMNNVLEEHASISRVLKQHHPVVYSRLVLKLRALCLYCGLFARIDLKGDFEGAFAEVHRSNMSKLDEEGLPIHDDAGKILKSSLFSEPVLGRFIGVHEGTLSEKAEG